MTYPSCLDLANLNASCGAVRKVGGVTSFVYFGSRKTWYDNHIATILPELRYGTIDTTNYGWIIDVDSSGSTGQELAKFEGLEYKNSAGFELVPGENVNLFNHNLNLIIYWHTQEELDKLQTLLLNEDMFAIVANNAGEIKVYGLERGKTYSPLGDAMFTDKMGLKNLSSSGGDIVELQGEMGVAVQLQAINMLNPPYYLIGLVDVLGPTDYTNYSDIITQLDLLCENNG